MTAQETDDDGVRVMKRDNFYFLFFKSLPPKKNFIAESLSGTLPILAVVGNAMNFYARREKGYEDGKKRVKNQDGSI